MNAVPAASLIAQATDWPVQRLHAPSSSLQRLPEADRSIVIKLLRPELGPLFQGDPPSVMDQAIRSFRAERLNLGGIPGVALSPSAGELCGSTGNCSFWIVDLTHRRVLLRSEGVQAFTLDTAKPHTTPDVLTATRSSTAESEMIRWHYLAGHYERGSCATLNDADDTGAPLNPPRITPHPCAPEGN